ncbi:MAG: site-specific integrase, partial [Rhodoblastus sp.]|nr:site-specific integrase [Rhodoblastus sp.]
MLRGLIASWVSHLSGERRMAKLTLDAYERDLRQFLDYVRERT